MLLSRWTHDFQATPRSDRAYVRLNLAGPIDLTIHIICIFVSSLKRK